jgi:TP901 family phage tail tape measure protein
MASASGIRMGRVFVEIGADPTKFFAAVSQMQRGLTRTLSGIQGNLNRFGGAMTTVGVGLAGLGAAITAPLALASRQFAQFDDAIRLTGAVSGATGADLQRLNDKALELGATTSYTAVQVASLMTELGRAGFKPDEINAMTGAVLDLARATGTDATLASGIMAATLRQFGLGATEASRAADTLTYAANATFNTVAGLGESLKYAGPVAKSLGMSLEDTVSILGALGNVGIQGSEAGTALRRLGVISAGAGEKLQALFGVSNVDAAGNLKPLIDILDEINTATQDMTVADRTSRMAKAFGLLGITSANVLSGSADTVRDLRDGIAAAGGVANRTSKAMDAGLGGAMRITLSAIEGASHAIANTMAPALQKIIEFIGLAAGSLTAFVKDNGEVVMAVGKAAVAATAAGGVLLGFAGIVKALAFGFGGLAAVSSLVLGPLVAIAGTAVALTIGFVKATAGVIAYAAASVASAAASGVAWAIANAPLLALLGILGALGAAVYGLMGGFTGLANNLKEGLVTAASNTALVFGDVKDAATAAMGGIYDAIVGGDLSGAIEIALKGLEVTARRIFNGLRSEIGGFQAFMVNTADAFQTYASQPLAMFDWINDPIVKADRDALNERMQKRLNAVPSGGQIQREQNKGMAELNDLATRARDTRIFRQQADDVTQSMTAAPSFDAMRELAEEFHALAASGKLGRDQMTKYAEAVDKATDRLSDSGRAEEAAASRELAARQTKQVMDQQAGDLLTNIGRVGSAAELESLQEEFEALRQFGRLSGDQESSISNALALAATQFAPETQQSQAEVAGTFSSMALGGLGFGSSLMQQIAKDTKRSADANEKMAAKQEDFEIQD